MVEAARIQGHRHNEMEDSYDVDLILAILAFLAHRVPRAVCNFGSITYEMKPNVPQPPKPDTSKKKKKRGSIKLSSSSSDE